MDEFELRGLKHESWSAFEKSGPALWVAIKRVTHQRMPDGLEMTTNLMESSGVRLNAHQAESPGGLNSNVVGPGRLHFTRFVLFQGRLDGALGGNLAHTPGLIGLFHPVLLEESGES